MQQVKKIALSSFAAVLVFLPVVASAAFNYNPNPQDGDSTWNTTGEGNVQSSGLPGGSIYNIIATTMKWLLAILGFIAVIGFVIAGILYLTAAGNEAQIEKAKTAMTYSIIGIIVALVGYVITQAVAVWLSASNTSF